jgi:hypothetical protein
MNHKIYCDKILSYAGNTAEFVIKTAEQMRAIAGTPHSHSYFMILWLVPSFWHHFQLQ